MTGSDACAPGWPSRSQRRATGARSSPSGTASSSGLSSTTPSSWRWPPAATTSSHPTPRPGRGRTTAASPTTCGSSRSGPGRPSLGQVRVGGSFSPGTRWAPGLRCSRRLTMSRSTPWSPWPLSRPVLRHGSGRSRPRACSSWDHRTASSLRRARGGCTRRWPRRRSGRSFAVGTTVGSSTVRGGATPAATTGTSPGRSSWMPQPVLVGDWLDARFRGGELTARPGVDLERR